MRRKEIIHNVIINRRVAAGPDSRDLGAILLFIFLLPYIISFFFGNAGRGDRTMGENGGAAEQSSYTEGADVFREDLEKEEFLICSRTAAGVEIMPLEAYLLRRLPATIDMGYETEALKAQAVVLRTELMRKYYDAVKMGEEIQRKGEKPCIHVEDRLVSAEGQSYEKCREAVVETRGMYMVLEGYPVKAPYFAVSAGTTRNGSEALAEEDYSYLKAVVCGRDFTAPDYAQSIRLSREAFGEKLAEMLPESGDMEGEGLAEQLRLTRDKSGYVTRVEAGEACISGECFRTVLSLPSACFELEERDGSVWIRTKGVGHGLGMSQYGADQAARKGSDFIDILKLFFSDVAIEKNL